MLDTNHDLFESDIALPRRSTLYHLPMEGGGTWNQESLLGYVHRLAHSHRVRVIDLLARVVIPGTDIKMGGYRFRFAEKHSRSTNGYGKYAYELSTAIAALTGVSGLDQGTFLPWQGLLDPKGCGLVHAKRRWCPSCMCDAELDDKPLIWPLLWSARCVTHCHIHLVALVSCCLSCGTEPKHLGDNLAIGRCDSCGHALGWRAGLLESDKPISERELFAATAISAMISLGAVAADVARPELLAKALKEIAESHTNGSIFTLARKIGVGKHTLASWVDLECRPQLDALVEVCYRLGLLPTELLAGRTLDREVALRPGEPPSARNLHRLSKDQLGAIEREIEAIIQSESTCVDAKSLAAKHCTSIGFIRYWLPEPYQQLTAHRKLVKAKQRSETVRQQMMAAEVVVRELFASSTHMPKSRLTKGLRSSGLTYTCPHVRQAVQIELNRLRQQRVPRPSSLLDDVTDRGA